jgi:hypothetical protein
VKNSKRAKRASNSRKTLALAVTTGAAAVVLVGLGVALVFMRSNSRSLQPQPVVEETAPGDKEVRKVTCAELAKEMVGSWRKILTTKQSHAAEEAALAELMLKYRDRYFDLTGEVLAVQDEATVEKEWGIQRHDPPYCYVALVSGQKGTSMYLATPSEKPVNFQRGQQVTVKGRLHALSFPPSAFVVAQVLIIFDDWKPNG